MLNKFKIIQANIIKCLIICALLQSTTSYAGIETLMKSVMPSGTLSNSIECSTLLKIILPRCEVIRAEILTLEQKENSSERF